jgi:hypothetical protein
MSALKTATSVDAGRSLDQILVGAQDMLRFVAPTIEASAAFLFRGLRIGIARHVDRFASQVDTGWQ